MHDDRLDFDTPLPAAASLLTAFARELDGRMEYGHMVSWSIESVRVSVPLELEIGDGSETVTVGASTPLVDFETSFTPLFHRATVTFVRSAE